MGGVKVYNDREGNALTVWFGNPADEYVAEEIGEEIVLMKDRDGGVSIEGQGVLYGALGEDHGR